MSYSIEWHGDELDGAASPEQAARNVLEMIKNSTDGGSHIFYLRHDHTGKLYRVDLGSEEYREGEPITKEISEQEAQHMPSIFRKATP